MPKTIPDDLISLEGAEPRAVRLRHVELFTFSWQYSQHCLFIYLIYSFQYVMLVTTGVEDLVYNVRATKSSRWQEMLQTVIPTQHVMGQLMYRMVDALLVVNFCPVCETLGVFPIRLLGY